MEGTSAIGDAGSAEDDGSLNAPNDPFLNEEM